MFTSNVLQNYNTYQKQLTDYNYIDDKLIPSNKSIIFLSFYYQRIIVSKASRLQCTCAVTACADDAIFNNERVDETGSVDTVGRCPRDKNSTKRTVQRRCRADITGSCQSCRHATRHSVFCN